MVIKKTVRILSVMTKPNYGYRVFAVEIDEGIKSYNRVNYCSLWKYIVYFQFAGFPGTLKNKQMLSFFNVNRSYGCNPTKTSLYHSLTTCEVEGQ